MCCGVPPYGYVGKTTLWECKSYRPYLRGFSTFRGFYCQSFIDVLRFCSIFVETEMHLLTKVICSICNQATSRDHCPPQQILLRSCFVSSQCGANIEWNFYELHSDPQCTFSGLKRRSNRVAGVVCVCGLVCRLDIWVLQETLQHSQSNFCLYEHQLIHKHWIKFPAESRPRSFEQSHLAAAQNCCKLNISIRQI